MVKQRVVLVTGAGASQAYGFPLGGLLTRQIAKSLIEESAGREMQACLRRTVASGLDPNRFDFTVVGRRIQASPLKSIDAFLQFDENRRWDTIAKGAVAWHIAIAECIGRCNPTAAEDDWLEYLFQHLLIDATTPDRLSSNSLSIVTFNFDRAVEWRWLNALRTVYEGLAGEALAQAFKSLEVVHVHGSIYADCGPAGFEAHPIGTAPSDAFIVGAARQINFIHDTVPPVLRAHELLERARSICFLGLSYAPMNLRRVGFPHDRPSGPRPPAIFGTTLGLEKGKVEALRSTLRSSANVHTPPQLLDMSCKALLEEVPVLHYG